jgi:UPF0755 protein
MNKVDGKGRIRWWEYPWYVLVLLFFGTVGVFMLLIDLLSGRIGRLNRTLSFAILIASVSAIVGSWAAFQYYVPLDLGETHKAIIIERGDSFDSVVRRLVSMGVVRSRLMMKYPARLASLDRRLTPGRYTFTGENSCRSVLARLERGGFDRIRVTIPEGMAIWKTAALLAEFLELDSAALVELNSDSAFLREIDLPYLEGFLFPETYFFPWGIDARSAVRKMIQMYRAKTDSLWSSVIADLSPLEAVVLASIIEAETRVDSERVIVSSVYTNRLSRNMKLDADPTVIYGLGGLERPLYRKDLQRESPYNTYLHKGLPPTPINSPGLAAIRAALNPTETEYLFFVADNSGGHRFSRTNAEHNRAIREIRGGD